MLSDKIRAFLSENHNGVLTTFRKSGAAQMSIITCGLYRDGAAFTTPAGTAKLRNLKQNPRCSLLISRPNWWGFLVLEGRAEILSPGVTEPEELRLALRDVYRAAAATEHPGWEEYDRAMSEQVRSAVIVMPEHVYGTVG